MKVTWSWLRDWVEFPGTPEDLAHALALRGLPVKALEQGATFDSGIVVGRVLEVLPHPNADRLSLCSVDIGSARLSIVCGASNVAAGQSVPVAQIGSRLPDGTKLRRTKIRGIESEGMICSKKELGLEADSEGIWPLSVSPAPGTPLSEALGPSDSVLDIEVTPNRSDCMSVVGLAREIASIHGTALKNPPPLRAEGPGPLPAVTIERGEDCPRYLARLVSGLRIGPSPEWLRRRLESTGFRSINNVVDVTNYILRQYGQPIHAFDAGLVRGNAIHVRRARPGETLVLLDGRALALHAGVLVIADAESPMALAGIMGGLDTGVSEKTAAVILECAEFDPVLTRAAARSLGVETDASARFIEGVDSGMLHAAIDETARLLAEVAGGTVAAGMAEQRATVRPRPAVRLRLSRLARLLGLAVDRAGVERALATLGIALEGAWMREGDTEVGRFLAPSHRRDLEIEEDLIEEVARVIGYDAIPSVVRTAQVGAMRDEAEPALEARIIRLGTGLGFNEAINTVLVGTVPREALPQGAETPLWQLQNPISRELRHLRPSLLPGLLTNVAKNLHHGVRDVRLIELGKVFVARPAPLGTEQVECALVLAGEPDPWRVPVGSPDRFLELKGAVEALLEALGIDSWGARFYDQSCWATGTGARLERDGLVLGRLGQVARPLAAWAGVEPPVWAAALDVAALSRAIPARRVYRALPRFPASKRDLAIVVGREVTHGEVVDLIRKHGGPCLVDVRLFDVFEGDQVGPGRKSMAYALDFRSPERTLSDREVDDTLAGIVRALGSELGATWRGGGAPTLHAAPTR